MKATLIKLIICMLLIQVTYSVSAQVKDTIIAPVREYTEVRQGNLTYHKSHDILRPVYEKSETKDLTGKSYRTFYLEYDSKYLEEVVFPVYRSVFSEERSKQIAGVRITCLVRLIMRYCILCFLSAAAMM